MSGGGGGRVCGFCFFILSSFQGKSLGWNVIVLLKSISLLPDCGLRGWSPLGGFSDPCFYAPSSLRLILQDWAVHIPRKLKLWVGRYQDCHTDQTPAELICPELASFLQQVVLLLRS